MPALPILTTSIRPRYTGTVAKKRTIPRKFASEAEEAEWWYQNREMISRDLEEAARAGELKVLDRKTLLDRIVASRSRVITIRLPVSDIELARQQAAKKGLPYQTYIKSLLHEALAENAKTR